MSKDEIMEIFYKIANYNEASLAVIERANSYDTTPAVVLLRDNRLNLALLSNKIEEIFSEEKQGKNQSETEEKQVEDENEKAT